MSPQLGGGATIGPPIYGECIRVEA